jgi:hypothetical protein
MKIAKRQLRRIIREEKALIEAYNSMSSRSKSLANAAKRQFAKDYPDVHVGIDGREGWLTVNGKKAVNMSQASGSPLSMDDIIDQMKQAYLGHPILSQEVPGASPGSRPGEHKLDFGKDIGTYNYRNEGTRMKISKRQLRRIIKEEKQKLLNEQEGDPRLAHELIKVINGGSVNADVGAAPDEVYIMIGGARNPDLDDGITIKVLRSGR